MLAGAIGIGAIVVGVVGFMLTRPRPRKISYHPQRHHYDDCH